VALTPDHTAGPGWAGELECWTLMMVEQECCHPVAPPSVVMRQETGEDASAASQSSEEEETQEQEQCLLEQELTLSPQPRQPPDTAVSSGISPA